MIAESPAVRVVALVAGFPPEIRKARRVFMLQAYIDESATPAYFVMAGYIAPVDRWCKFSEEWAKLLSMRSPHYRRIDEFHATEMHDSPLSLEHSEWFYRVIEGNVESAVSVAIDLDAWNRVDALAPWPDDLPAASKYLTPHLYAFRKLTRGFETCKDRLGIKEKVDFVFDSTSNKRLCLAAWEILQREDQWFRENCGEAPIFRDSEATLPLQAADMLAHYARAHLERGGDFDAGPDFPWARKVPIPELAMHFGYQDQLRDRLAQIASVRAAAMSGRKN